MVAPHDGCVDWNFKHILYITDTNLSHPTMGAWIEIFDIFLCPPNLFNVAPHDGCVDWNCVPLWYICIFCGRTPRWVRGLKFCLHFLSVVLPHCRTPRWVRGLKLTVCVIISLWNMSHPTMGAWIEILNCWLRQLHNVVAPHDGCVDWNRPHTLLLLP